MKIPSLDSFSPRLVELRATLARLNAAVDEKKTECAAIRTAVDESRADPDNLQTVRAKRLLGEVPPEADVGDLKRLGILLAELDDLAVAINMARGQIGRETYIASAKLCESIAPQHAAVAQPFVDAMLALHKAHVEYDAFFNTVENTGAATSSIARLHNSWLGSPADVNSGYRHWLLEAIEAKQMTERSMPKVLK